MSLSRNNALVKPGRKFAYQQIGFSILVVFICAFITYLFWGLSYTYSVLSGGAIGIIPNFILAYKAFKYAGATSSKLVVESFFSGVKLKMAATALLFGLAFKFIVIIPLPFFGMFCLIMVMPLLTPFFLKH
ncbi:MAG: ATP synthase subunit I [Alteromonadaceae bacterium]|nr:ATP synthase subunit I [Alteromonadaceae bacterium]